MKTQKELGSWYQIVPASGLSADYLNKPGYALDRVYVVDHIEDITPEFVQIIRKKVQEIESYAEYAKGCARRSSKTSSQYNKELAIYINEASKDRVAEIDRIVQEMKTMVEGEITLSVLIALFERYQRISAVVMGGRLEVFQRTLDLRKIQQANAD